MARIKVKGKSENQSVAEKVSNNTVVALHKTP